MRVHYSFKYWHGSNWKTRNIYTLNSCFPCSSMKRLDRDVERRQARLFFSVIVSTSWRTNFDDRGWSKADLFQRPNRGPEFDGIQFRSGFRPSAVVSARCTVPSVYHANLGRMQIAFHNLLPVPCSLRVYRPDLRLENRALPPAFSVKIDVSAVYTLRHRSIVSSHWNTCSLTFLFSSFLFSFVLLQRFVKDYIKEKY